MHGGVAVAGDRALCLAAARIVRSIRTDDLLTRYGGDEFVILARGTDGVEATRLAERIRRAVEGLRLGASGQTVPITLSIGVAALAELAPNDEPVAALLALADWRMYRAKESGRNRVCASGNAKRISVAPLVVRG